MARALRYADWRAGLQKKGPASACLFVGPESLLRDQALAELRDAMGTEGALPPIERFQGGEAPLSQVVTAFSTVGLFAPSRLVVVSNVEKYGRVSARDREELLRTVREAAPGSCLVALSDLPLWEFERKNAFCKSLLSTFTVVEFAHPRPAEALRWIVAESARRKVKLQPEAGELLVQKIGPSLQELAREIEKLAIWAEPGETVTTERLRELMREGFLGSVGELTDAALSGRATGALQQWNGLGGTEPVLRVVWLLQQRARERLAQGGADPARLDGLARGAYALEKGIKSGRLPGGSEETALECLFVSHRAVQRRPKKGPRG